MQCDHLARRLVGTRSRDFAVPNSEPLRSTTLSPVVSLLLSFFIPFARPHTFSHMHTDAHTHSRSITPPLNLFLSFSHSLSLSFFFALPLFSPSLFAHLTEIPRVPQSRATTSDCVPYGEEDDLSRLSALRPTQCPMNTSRDEPRLFLYVVVDLPRGTRPRSRPSLSRRNRASNPSNSSWLPRGDISANRLARLAFISDDVGCFERGLSTSLLHSLARSLARYRFRRGELAEGVRRRAYIGVVVVDG